MRGWQLVVCVLQAAVALILITQWLAISRPPQPALAVAQQPHTASAKPTLTPAAVQLIEQPMSVSVVRIQPPDAPLSNLSMHTVSCPIFSGPGYDARRHASRDVVVPEFEAPFASKPRPPTLAVDAMPLSDVSLLPGSAFHSAFETNLQYLKLLSTDSLLLAWRLTAQGGRWKPGSLRLMGWEHTGSELRGHFLGHWLSASAMAFAATRDAELGHRMAAG